MLSKDKLKRISELANKSKQQELSSQEKKTTRIKGCIY